jgi:hypothetical protein
VSRADSLRNGGRTPGTVAILAILAVVLFAAPALAAATIALDPGLGPPGIAFRVSGEGFDPAEKVQIRWDGSPLSGPVLTDSGGAFSVTYTVPLDAQPGTHRVTARGLKSSLTAERIFNVRLASTTTTTVLATTTTVPATTTAPAPTTTTAGPPPTTAAGTPTSTAGSGAVTTTTETGDATTLIREEQATAVIEFSVSPDAVAQGGEIEVKATLTGEVASVELWLDDRALGPPITVGAGGALRVTETVPDLAPGTHTLRLRTIEGRLLATGTIELLSSQTADTGVSDVSDVFDIASLMANPVGFFALIAMALVAGFSVWLMWKPPRDEKEEREGAR